MRFLWLWIIFLACVDFISRSATHTDGYMWLPTSLHFFQEITGSDARNRPLFPFLHFLILKPLILLNPKWDNTAFACEIWRLGNWVFIGLSAWFAYQASLMLTASKNRSVIFAFLSVVSAQFLTWASHSGVSIHGFFIHYVAFWGLARWVSGAKEPIRFACAAGLVYGFLMLGKPQYNILGAVAAYVVLFRRKDLRYLLVAFGTHLIPIVAWLGVLAASEGLQFYEFSNPKYSIASLHLDLARESGGWAWYLLTLPNRFILELNASLMDGLGFLGWLATWLFLFRARNQFAWIYFGVTALLLFGTRVLAPRHAGDFAMIAHWEIAGVLMMARSSWLLTASFLWTFYQAGPWFTRPLIDQCAQSVKPSVCQKKLTP